MSNVLEKHADELFCEYGEIAKTYIKEGKEHVPMFIFFGEDNKHVVMFFNYRNQEEKLRGINALKYKVNSEEGRSQFKEYLFLFEGWGVIFKDEKEIKKVVGKVAEQPDRMEYILLLYAHQDGYKKSKRIQIFREDNKITFIDTEGGENCESIFYLYN